MSKSALIGYTGFVGNNLLKQASFDYFYNSKNIHEIEGNHFDTVVCTGVSAVKWYANLYPDIDIQNINKLLGCLSTISAEKFILISTVDVYPSPINVNENTIIDSTCHAYAKHRLEVELFINKFFENSFIIRLPALFGAGLKKNILFDLLNNNELEKINLNNQFQWYSMATLWEHVKIAITHDIKLINLVTPPIKTSDIIQQFFPEKRCKIHLSDNPIAYNVKTQHSGLFSKENDYITNEAAVWDELEHFIRDYGLNAL